MVDSIEDLLTVREVAEQLRVDDTTVRRWIKNGVAFGHHAAASRRAAGLPHPPQHPERPAQPC